MTATKILCGQILIVFVIVLATIWLATQYAISIQKNGLRFDNYKIQFHSSMSDSRQYRPVPDIAIFFKR